MLVLLNLQRSSPPALSITKVGPGDQIPVNTPFPFYVSAGVTNGVAVTELTITEQLTGVDGAYFVEWPGQCSFLAHACQRKHRPGRVPAIGIAGLQSPLKACWCSCACHTCICVLISLHSAQTPHTPASLSECLSEDAKRRPFYHYSFTTHKHKL